jgi:hypothetical protein
MGRLLMGALVATGVALGSLLLAEILLRALNLAPTVGVTTVTRAEFERVPGIFAPSQVVIDRRIPALAHTVTINSLGYRGGEILQEKPKGSSASCSRVILPYTGTLLTIPIPCRLSSKGSWLKLVLESRS